MQWAVRVWKVVRQRALAGLGWLTDAKGPSTKGRMEGRTSFRGMQA